MSGREHVWGSLVWVSESIWKACSHLGREVPTRDLILEGFACYLGDLRLGEHVQRVSRFSDFFFKA